MSAALRIADLEAENARLKQEIASLEHRYHLARQFADDVNGPSEKDQTIRELQAQITGLQRKIEAV